MAMAGFNTVKELNRKIERSLRGTKMFEVGEFYVIGTVLKVTEAKSGYVYLELGDEGVKPSSISVMASPRTLSKIASRRDLLRQGEVRRITAKMSFYRTRSSLQLELIDVDESYVQERERDVESVVNELLESGVSKNSHPIPLLPMRVALITGEGSSAENDFNRTLSNSQLPFEVVRIPVTVSQSQQVINALGEISKDRVDVVAIIRGGGDQAGLSSFNDPALATAIARSSLPVLTGLGHEEDRHVVDAFATESRITPTAVAARLVKIVQDEVGLVESLSSSIEASARNHLTNRRLEAKHSAPLIQANSVAVLERHASSAASAEMLRSHCNATLERLVTSMPSSETLKSQCQTILREADASRVISLDLARARLATEKTDVLRLIDNVRERSEDILETPRLNIDGMQEALSAAFSLADSELDGRSTLIAKNVSARLDADRAPLAKLDQRTRDLNPANLLKRGLTITRRQSDGRIIKDADEALSMDSLVTQFRDGSVTSKIEK